MSDEKHEVPAPDEHPAGASGHRDEAAPDWSPDWLEGVAEKKPDSDNAAPFEDFMSDWLVSQETKPEDAESLPPIVTSNDDFALPPLVNDSPASSAAAPDEAPIAEPMHSDVVPANADDSVEEIFGSSALPETMPPFAASDDGDELRLAPAAADEPAVGGPGPETLAEADWSMADDDEEQLAPLGPGEALAATNFETPLEHDWSVDEGLKGSGSAPSGLGSPAEVHWPASNVGEYDVEGGGLPSGFDEIAPPPPPTVDRPAARASAPPPKRSPKGVLATAAGLLLAAIVPAGAVFFIQQNKLKASDEARKAAEQKSETAAQLAEQQRKRADDLAKEAETFKTAQEEAAAKAESEKTRASKLADIEKQLGTLKTELDAEKAKRSEAEEAAQKAQRIAEEALAGGKKPAPGAAGKAQEAVAALKKADEPEAVSKGLSQLMRTAFDADDPAVLESAASGLSDRASALIKACEEAAANEQDPKLKARYALFELLLHEESDKQAGDKQGARERRRDTRGPVIPVRRVALRVALAPSDSDDRLKQKLAIVDRVIENDPDELSAYLRKGRLLLELGRSAQNAARNEDAQRDFDAAAKAFREGLTRLKQTPERDRSGKVALGLSEGFNEVLLSRPASSPSPAPEEEQGELKTLRAQLDSAQTALKAARSDLKTALAQRDEARSRPAPAPASAAPASSSANALAEARAHLSTVTAELAAAKAAAEQANRAVAWQRGADQHWAEFAARTARLAGYDQPLPAAGPQRSAWITGLASALETRLIEGTAPPELAHPRTDDALAAYSTGLDLLYQGNYPGAIRKLSEAIQLDPRDARFFYFRGIAAYLASGGVNVPADAVNDVRRGVALERQALPSSYDVGRALVRIQNQARDWVESIRNPARQVPVPAAAR